MNKPITLDDYLTVEQYAEKYHQDPKIVKKIAKIAYRYNVAANILGQKRIVVFPYNSKVKKDDWRIRPEKESLQVFNDFFSKQTKKSINETIATEPTTSKKHVETKKIPSQPTSAWSINKFAVYYLGETKEDRKVVREAVQLAFDTSVSISIKDDNYNIVFKNDHNGLRIRPEESARDKLFEIVKQLQQQAKGIQR